MHDDRCTYAHMACSNLFFEQTEWNSLLTQNRYANVEFHAENVTENGQENHFHKKWKSLHV